MQKVSVEFLPLGLSLCVLCVFGILGNVMSALVLRRPRMQSTYSILTLGLTYCDILYLLMKFFRYGLMSAFEYADAPNVYTDIIYPVTGPYTRAITFTAQTASTYFTIVLAIDRYISICWPVQGRTLCTRKRAMKVSYCVVLFAILYNIPRWFEYYTKISVVDENLGQAMNENRTLQHQQTYIYSMEVGDLKSSPIYKELYIFWGYFFIMWFTPFTSLSFFNYKIFKAVHEANKAREKLTSTQKRDMSFAVMLLSVVVLFILCSFDYMVLDILNYVGHPYPVFWESLGNFSLTVNFAGNFIIYCVFGNRFRKELKGMLVGWREYLKRKAPCDFPTVPDLLSRNTNTITRTEMESV